MTFWINKVPLLIKYLWEQWLFGRKNYPEGAINLISSGLAV